MKDKQLVKEMDVDWLKQRYFSDLSRRVYLKKGDVLLQPGMHNERLYLIIRGLVCGYLESELGEPYEIFRSGRGHFVGVYSYFSKAHQSYSRVVAEEDTLLAYIDAEQKVAPDEDGRTFADHFLPVVVNEVYMRQLLAQKMSIEREAAMKRLFHAEKMATLGQMAAGLAHELNNAVGVINRKAEWIAERAAEYIRTRDPEGWYAFFEKGFQEGQKLSTEEIRKRKRELEERFSLKSSEAKQLASIGLSDEELRPYSSDLSRSVRQIAYYFETGLALHDMLLAAHHAADVVQSVKELAVSDHRVLVETDIGHSLREAVSLLKDLLKKIRVSLDIGELPRIRTNPGELLQIWVNLIKNAVESLLAAGTRNAAISIGARFEENAVMVSIADNGPGIPPELLPTIFQPNVTTKVKGLSFGLGLGLSIVQRIVQHYGGQIEVSSRPGETEFVVTLPVEE